MCTALIKDIISGAGRRRAVQGQQVAVRGGGDDRSGRAARTDDPVPGRGSVAGQGAGEAGHADMAAGAQGGSGNHTDGGNQQTSSQLNREKEVILVRLCDLDGM